MRRLCYDRRLIQLVSSRSNEVSWLPEYTEYLLLLLLLHILILYFKYSMFWQPLFLFFMTYPDDFISSDFVNVPLEHTLDTTTKTVNSVADSSLWLVLLSNYRLWISCHIAELLWCFLTRINLYYQHSDAHSTSSPGDIFQLPHTLAKEIFICIISVIFYTDSVSKRWKMFWKVFCHLAWNHWTFSCRVCGDRTKTFFRQSITFSWSLPHVFCLVIVACFLWITCAGTGSSLLHRFTCRW